MTPPVLDPADAPAANGRPDPVVQFLTAVRKKIGTVVVGQDVVVERALIALLTSGHLLLEGVPGLAKTLLVACLAKSIDLAFARVQFTIDLLPSDILGAEILDQRTNTFRVNQGPVFTNLLLADEINRAAPKVQSALLEAMQERRVTIGKEAFKLPAPFLVIATQNPVESEGVYPLPEAQRDRFLLKVDVPYPRGNEEFEILRRMSVDPPSSQPVLNPDLIRQLQRQAESVFVHNLVAEYIVRLVLATRTPAEFNLPDLTSVIQIGCSPRATLGLVAASRALALIHGRDYVLPTDVQAVAKDVMAHRITLAFDAVADNIAPAQVVERIVAMVPPPTPVWNQPGGQAQPDHQQPQLNPQQYPPPPGNPQSANHQPQPSRTYPGQPDYS